MAGEAGDMARRVPTRSYGYSITLAQETGRGCRAKSGDIGIPDVRVGYKTAWGTFSHGTGDPVEYDGDMKWVSTQANDELSPKAKVA